MVYCMEAVPEEIQVRSRIAGHKWDARQRQVRTDTKACSKRAERLSLGTNVKIWDPIECVTAAFVIQHEKGWRDLCWTFSSRAFFYDCGNGCAWCVAAVQATDCWCFRLGNLPPISGFPPFPKRTARLTSNIRRLCDFNFWVCSSTGNEQLVSTLH